MTSWSRGNLGGGILEIGGVGDKGTEIIKGRILMMIITRFY